MVTLSITPHTVTKYSDHSENVLTFKSLVVGKTRPPISAVSLTPPTNLSFLDGKPTGLLLTTQKSPIVPPLSRLSRVDFSNITKTAISLFPHPEIPQLLSNCLNLWEFSLQKYEHAIVRTLNSTTSLGPNSELVRQRNSLSWPFSPLWTSSEIESIEKLLDSSEG